MSRKFTKNTANYCTIGTGALGPYLAGAKQLSISAWAFPVTLDGGSNDNCILDVLTGASNAILLNVTTGTTLRYVSRSATGDTGGSATSSANVTTGKWWQVGGWCDYTTAGVQCYLNGVANGSQGTPTYAQSSFTYSAPSQPDSFAALSGSGVPPAQTSQWNGWLADVAIWRAKLGAAEWAALGQGVAPGRIRPGSLVAWWPMIHPGNQVPDAGPFRRHGKLVGSVPAAPDPPRPGRPLIIPRRRALEAFTVAGGGPWPWFLDQSHSGGFSELGI